MMYINAYINLQEKFSAKQRLGFKKNSILRTLQHSMPQGNTYAVKLITRRSRAINKATQQWMQALQIKNVCYHDLANRAAHYSNWVSSSI